MSRVEILGSAIEVLKEIYDSKDGTDWLCEVMGQSGGSVIDALNLVVVALSEKGDKSL